MFPCHRLLVLLLLKGGDGIFNVRNDLCACCAHEGETGTDESAQVLTQKNSKTALHSVTSREEYKTALHSCHIQRRTEKQPFTLVTSRAELRNSPSLCYIQSRTQKQPFTLVISRAELKNSPSLLSYAEKNSKAALPSCHI